MYTARSRGLYSRVRASPAPTLAACSRMPRIRVVGFERPAADDADRRQLTGPFGIEGPFGFLLDDLVDLLEEAEVVGVDAVERRLRDVHESGLGRIVGCRQRVDPCRQQGVQPVEGADHHPVRVRRRLEHEVPVGNLAVMVRAAGTGTCRPDRDRVRRCPCRRRSAATDRRRSSTSSADTRSPSDRRLFRSRNVVP